MFDNVVVPKLMLEALLGVKRPASYKIVMLLLQHGFLDENKLQGILRRRMKDVHKACAELMEKEIVRRWVHKDDGIIIYSLDNRFFDLDDICEQCIHRFYKEVNGDEKIRYTMCKFQVKLIKCIHDYARTYNGLLKTIKARYKRKHMVEEYNRGVSKKYEMKHVDEWNRNDFARFFKTKIEEEFPNSVVREREFGIRFNIEKCMGHFKKACKTKWRRYLKQFMIQTIKKFKKDDRDIVKSEYLTAEYVMLDFLKKSNLKKADHCEEKEIYCSYCLNGKCTLEDSGIKCTDVTVERMKEKYN